MSEEEKKQNLLPVSEEKEIPKWLSRNTVIRILKAEYSVLKNQQQLSSLQ